MFTGVIEAMGEVTAINHRGDDIVLTVHSADLDFSDVNQGDSIAVNGTCLTVVTVSEQQFSADVSGETLARTTFHDLKVGTVLNLEKALTLKDRLGGHLVSGHVDGIGEVVHQQDDGRSMRYRIRAPQALAKYIAEKGSICIEGISLTVNVVDGNEFEVNIVPYTSAMTTVQNFKSGTKVNLEVDIIARYLERLLTKETALPQTGRVTLALLKEYGFVNK